MTIGHQQRRRGLRRAFPSACAAIALLSLSACADMDASSDETRDESELAAGDEASFDEQAQEAPARPRTLRELIEWLRRRRDGGTGTPDAGTGTPDGGTGTPDAGGQVDLGKGDGRDVITIGDSWMQLLTTGIQQSLKRASGNQPYRLYGVPGTRLLNGQIPGQYDRAKREDPDIKTVVMTGGGNDLLLTNSGNDCPTAGPNCRAQIDKVADGLVALWAQMARDGVQDVVYIEYSRGGTNAASVEYGSQKIRPLCEAAPVDCHWVDSDAIINRQLRPDGIHPTDASYDKLGRAVYQLMETEGMRR